MMEIFVLLKKIKLNSLMKVELKVNKKVLELSSKEESIMKKVILNILWQKKLKNNL